MKHFSLRIFLAAWFALLSAVAGAQVAPTRPPLPNLDRRAPAAASLPDERAFVSAPDRFLTPSAVSWAAIPANDPYRATRAFLLDHRALFGHGPEALDQARVVREFRTPNNGVRTVVWEQVVDGIPVFEATLIAHTTKSDELVNLGSRFVPDPVKAAAKFSTNRAAFLASPKISAAQAVNVAARNIGENVEPADISANGNPAGAEQKQKFKAAFLAGDAEAKLIWLPFDRDTLRPCWDVVLTGRQRGEMFRVLVDAETGEVQVRRGLTQYLSDATFRVFTSDSPSSFSPGFTTPSNSQPPLVARVLVTLPALDTNASPAGWINDGANETLGNNVDAHTDRNADNAADLPRPHGSPFRVFDFALDLAQDPTNSSAAAVVQLFYWNNFMHDKLYALGFTEAAGNFQADNFGRGGLGNDAVQADAQDGSGFNNANFSTPPDGSPGRMQMYLFNGPSPGRDGDLDATVVLHEYTHGLTNRRVGGGVGISATQTLGLGEGWSDFYALSLLSKTNDDPDAPYPVGAYVSYQLSGLAQNYYYGIRRYPYCTDVNKNPLTFKDIDPAQASSHPGVARNPVAGGTADEVHNQGEVWCATLWDARARLIARYGAAAGNQLMLQLVTDGLNLAPANPNFLQARDAILQADLIDNAGANRAALWVAFAKRGLGYGATSPASFTTSGVVEAFDVPDDLRVSALAFNSSGQRGGPFAPSCQTYSLANAGTGAVTWVAYPTQPWLTVSPAGGTLAAGASNTVDVCLAASAKALNVGSFAASVVFSNTASGVAQTRAAFTYVTLPRVYFFSFDTDPGWARDDLWTFGPPAGAGGATHGVADPAAGATGANVFGFNLNGDYPTGLGGPCYLTAGPLSFVNYSGVKLQFERWLNTDYQPYVYATIEISTNGGATWSTVWSNGTSEITDTAWSRQSIDLSAYADNRDRVYVRWGHRVGTAGAFAYSGWNLDDVEFDGTLLPPQLQAQSTGGAMSLAWPAVYSNYVLETSATLSPPSWTPVSDAAVSGGGQCVVSISSTGTAGFYRLRAAGW